MVGQIIIIEGNVSSGKTTLTKSLEKYLRNQGKDVVLMLEPINPDLLDLYISDMKKYAFPFQVIMVEKRIAMYRKADELRKQGKIVIIDRGILGDIAFAIMQHDKGFFTDKEFIVYSSMTKDLERGRLPVPDKVIYLDCSPETAMKRMHSRGIEAEKSGYSLQYLRDLEKSHKRILSEGGLNCSLDWNRNFELVNDCLPDEVCEEIFSFEPTIVEVKNYLPTPGKLQVQ